MGHTSCVHHGCLLGHTCIHHGCLLRHTCIYHGCLLTFTGSWVYCMHVRSSLVHTSSSVLHTVRWVLTVLVPLRVPHPETCIPECITLGLHPGTCVYWLRHRLLCLGWLRHPSCILFAYYCRPTFLIFIQSTFTTLALRTFTSNLPS